MGGIGTEIRARLNEGAPDEQLSTPSDQQRETVQRRVERAIHRVFVDFPDILAERLAADRAWTIKGTELQGPFEDAIIKIIRDGQLDDKLATEMARAVSEILVQPRPEVRT